MAKQELRYLDITDLDFRDWMIKIDDQIDASLGISIQDLPDQPYRDWFDSGMEISEAIREIMEKEYPELMEMEEE